MIDISLDYDQVCLLMTNKQNVTLELQTKVGPTIVKENHQVRCLTAIHEAVTNTSEMWIVVDDRSVYKATHWETFVDKIHTPDNRLLFTPVSLQDKINLANLGHKMTGIALDDI